MTQRSTTFDDEYVSGFCDIYENRIVFNQEIGVHITSVEPGLVYADVKFDDPHSGTIGGRQMSGGAISVALDSIGSASVFSAVGAMHTSESAEARLNRFMKLGTIDLHVQYLRDVPHGICTVKSSCLSIDSQIGRSECEVRDSNGDLVAMGFGTYIVS